MKSRAPRMRLWPRRARRNLSNIRRWRFRRTWKCLTNQRTQVFIVVDFAICAEGDRLVPRLIELQAFPSLFGFQLVLLDCIRKAYPIIPRNWTSSFGGIKDDAYLELLRRTIIADSPVESVVLLDIEPEKQKTRVDFAATETFLGIRPVCVTKIKKRGRQLFYDRDGREVRIERIYNRVIFDELSQRHGSEFTVSFSG